MNQNQMEKIYEQKYLKYKAKYLELKNQIGKGVENLVANQQSFTNSDSPFWKLEINVADRTNNNKSVGIVTFNQQDMGGFLLRPNEIVFFPYPDFDIKMVAREFAWPLIKNKYSPAEIEAFNMRGLFRRGPGYGPGPGYYGPPPPPPSSGFNISFGGPRYDRYGRRY